MRECELVEGAPLGRNAEHFQRSQCGATQSRLPGGRRSSHSSRTPDEASWADDTVGTSRRSVQTRASGHASTSSWNRSFVSWEPPLNVLLVFQLFTQRG